MASLSTDPTANRQEEEEGGGGSSVTPISALPSDVLTHILNLLDGPTLASASCASAYFHAISSHPPIWRRLCRSSWPSSDHPRVAHLISTFPSSFHSFFSDASTTLSSSTPLPPRVAHPPTDHLISAVDLRCGETLIFSRVLETETLSSWFCSSPFRIDVLDHKDHPPLISGVNVAADLSLSWIVIDPVRRRAANLSSLHSVSVQRHWFSGDTQVRFATILGSESDDSVQCGIVVTCGGCEGERGGGGMHVREVSLQVEDMDGTNLNGKESLEILQRAMEGKRKRKRGREEGDEMKERYSEYLRRKMEKKEKKMRREGRLDMACLVFGLSIFSAFLGFIWLL